ncbi:hypothetical protein DFQ14_106138 [Halopolyspora algeriensis]|uniref:Magnesium transporter NIPA n=1 Tax=Halopolyspora algeriensis TaxID=1500506 RepID=A0A368VQ38_9ACTN|nr:hypothetical protein [Halopolyspora algeriensis]RCW43660.1 hypothetical protein DFQ14_106138 [Halopolyspora algeriensis]TQM47557.1 hypothetical protein FHU43_3551 [Halopolyspora algeriensis]
MTLLAVALAALAACGCAVGARMQHGAVHTTTEGRGFGIRSQLRLVRTPRWLLGLGCLMGGALLHAVALGLAPLSVVQPIGVLALPITVLLNVREQGLHVRDIHRSAVFAVVASTGGVAAFVLLAAGSATATPVSDEAASTAIRLVAGMVLILGGIAVLNRGNVRCVAYAAGCAVCYGLVSLLMRAVSQQVTVWELAEISLLPPVGLVTALLVGGWLLQHSYASGPPDLVVACLTVIDPLVAVGLGIGLLGEADNVGMWTATGEAVCAMVACAGVFVLARYHPEQQQRPPDLAVAGGRGLAGPASMDRS